MCQSWWLTMQSDHSLISNDHYAIDSGKRERHANNSKMSFRKKEVSKSVLKYSRLLNALAVFFVILFFYSNQMKQVDCIAPGPDILRSSPFSSYFNNPYDYADAESYGTNVFNNLIRHMNMIKREKDTCGNIPMPKTVLSQKYFNPMYEFLNHKFWYPPRDHQYVVLWSQLESYRNSLFLSYMLQDENAKFPPGNYSLTWRNEVAIRI